jgi:hypothetical protein
MRARHALPATIALALVALSGCSDEPTRAGGDASSSTGGTASAGSTSLPSGSASGSASGSPGDSSGSTPTGSADDPQDDASGTSSDAPGKLPTSRIEAANLHVAVLGRNAAGSPEEQAVVEAWMAFWQGTADTYYFYRPTAQFDRVARGSARSQVIDYMTAVRAKKERVVGWARDNVTSVEVTGSRATVRDCTKNFTFRVDNEAEPISRPDAWYDVTGTLRRTADGWTVVAQTSKPQDASCLT